MLQDYDAPIRGLWTDAAQTEFDDLRKAILANPCLWRVDHCKLLVLCTDFSGEGFGYVALHQVTMMHCSMQCTPACKEANLPLWQRIPKLYSTPLHLGVVALMATNAAFIHT
jgi:hypothetical protein